jgi:SHS family lactate transporter-like MFS transporter
LIAFWRIFLPETEAFLNVKRAREAIAHAGNQMISIDVVPLTTIVFYLDKSGKSSPMRTFLRTIRPALIDHWPILIYLVLMMTGFNFLSHGSQDLYPTFLASTLQFSHGLVTVTTVVANIGALIGGMTVGYFSSFFGRRLSILVVLIVGAVLIPAYLLPQGTTIMAGAFFQQMCVQGVWGVVPIHLIELSPVQFRSFVVGTAYQIGNLISSASSTIEATAGQHFPKQTSSTDSTHSEQYDYGKVMAIFLASVYVYLFVIIFLGPEKRNIDEASTTTTTEKTNVDQKETNNDIPLEDSSPFDYTKNTNNV